MKKVKLVIVGMGFAGAYTYRSLVNKVNDDFEVTLLDKKNYFLFTPMLHEVATGGLHENLVTEPIRELIKGKNTRFIQKEVLSVDLKNRILSTKDGSLNYDVLVISTGSSTFFPKNANLSKNTFPLKTLEDALNIKRFLIRFFEEADCQKECELSFAVVGGGPTGVELCMEIKEFIDHTFLKFYKNIKPEMVKLHLIDTQKELLSYFSPSQRKYAQKYLKENGVVIHNNRRVLDIKENIVVTDKGDIKAKGVFWAAGVQGCFPEINSTCVSENSRLEVNDYLQLINHPEVFVLGDAASGFPMLAYTATQQAKVVAQNIIAFSRGGKLNKFSFTPAVKLMSLGRNNAMAEIFGLKLHGRLVWFMWRTVYLFKVISFRKKIQIALNWTFHLFSPRDITGV